MGPFVHRSVMKQVKKAISHIAVIKVGDLFDVIEPDLTKQHDNWINRINIQFEVIKNNLRENKDISRDVRIVAHFIIDYFAFTQSFGGFKKNSDMKIDIAAEFVFCKDKFNPILKTYQNKDEIKNAMLNEIKSMNEKYGDIFKKSWFTFILSKKFREFVRESIQKTTEFTYAYVQLAKDSSYE